MKNDKSTLNKYIDHYIKCRRCDGYGEDSVPLFEELWYLGECSMIPSGRRKYFKCPTCNGTGKEFIRGLHVNISAIPIVSQLSFMSQYFPGEGKITIRLPQKPDFESLLITSMQELIEYKIMSVYRDDYDKILKLTENPASGR